MDQGVKIVKKFLKERKQDFVSYDLNDEEN